MTPDPRPKRGLKKKRMVSHEEIEHRTKRSSEDIHEIAYFERHKDDDPDCHMPARDFLSNECPPNVRIKLQNILIAVAKAPPKKFAGGGAWEAMSGDMNGWFEVRVDGPPSRTHFRLFCLIDYDAIGESEPLLVVVTGMKKRFRTTFNSSDYAKVRILGDEYLKRNPRSTA